MSTQTGVQGRCATSSQRHDQVDESIPASWIMTLFQKKLERMLKEEDERHARDFYFEA